MLQASQSLQLQFQSSVQALSFTEGGVVDLLTAFKHQHATVPSNVKYQKGYLVKGT
jgi:hypothetical protein